jgi:hypothetical protein
MPQPQQNGFTPIIRDGGGPFSLRRYAKLATDPTAIANWDVVMKVAGSVPLPEKPDYTLPCIQGAFPGGVAGTTFWLGSAITYGAPSRLTIHAVADEADCVFHCALANFAGAPTSTAAITGKNANIFGIATVPPIVRSKHILDTRTAGVNPALDCRIRRIAFCVPNYDSEGGFPVPNWGNVGEPGALASGSHNIAVEVTFNKHFHGQATAGA